MLPSQIDLFTCSALGKPKSQFHLPGNSTIVNKCKRFHLCFLHDPAFYGKGARRWFCRGGGKNQEI